MTDQMMTDLPSGWGIPKNLIYDKVLPSGAKVRLRKLELEDLAELGVLDEMDAFTPKAMSGNVVKKDSEPAAIDTAKQITKVLDLMDKIAVAALIKPEVHPRLKDGEEPVEGRLYVNGIPANDRGAIFEDSVEEIGSFLGTGGEQGGDVGDMATEQSSEQSA